MPPPASAQGSWGCRVAAGGAAGRADGRGGTWFVHGVVIIQMQRVGAFEATPPVEPEILMEL